MVDEIRRSTKCARCGRKLTDPTSVRRGMGPVCWAACKGDVFEKDLEASDEEWAEREQDLKAGAEIDFGCNWRYMPDPNSLPVSGRISLRYVGSEDCFEAYAHVPIPEPHEISLGKSRDIRIAYEIAVRSGPEMEATAYRMTRAARRRSRRVA